MAPAWVMPSAPNLNREMISTSTGSQREESMVATAAFMSDPPVSVNIDGRAVLFKPKDP